MLRLLTTNTRVFSSLTAHKTSKFDSIVSPGNLYTHYKGHRYKVLHLAKHTESEEQMVVYQRISQPVDTQVWVRPLGMFTEFVNIDGVIKPRFTRLD